MSSTTKESSPSLRADEAAEYLGISRFTLRNMRQSDAKAITAGEPMRGPAFIRVGKTLCLYRKCDLDSWLEKQARETIADLRKSSKPRLGRGRA